MELKDIKGKPNVRPGSKLGYFLWKESDGFHLLWMTMGAMHGFRGKITAKKPVTIKKLVKLESNDVITQVDPNTISWETRTQNDTDGLIFESEGNFTVELLMDSKKIGLSNVFCGLTLRKPTSNPFTVNLL
jgi:hypothetical protein